MNSQRNNDGPAWREASADELAAREPFTLLCEGLSAASIREVNTTCRLMFRCSVGAFVRHFDRPPNEHEAELLGIAVVQHLNSFVVPPMAERDAATIQ